MSPFPYDCRPDVRFWRPYINGTSFPDCRSIELNHYWSAPPCDAVPLITIARHANDSCRNGNFGPKHIQAELSTPIGLRKLESLSLEYVLELHKDVLQQLFKSRMADNLRILELRFCLMGNDMIADLMEVALPSLTHFTFLDRISSDAAESSREALNHNDHSGGHLCPRVRKFGKNLHHLYLAVPYVCRDLFLSEAEADALHRAGIVTDIGTPEGNLADGMNLDRYAIKQVLSEHRRKQSTLRKNAFIAQAIAEAKVSNPALGAESMFGGGGSTIELKAARDAEYAFDQEAIKRARTISDTKGRWTRTIVAWDGLCRDDETWAELMVEADLEDVGVEWVLASKLKSTFLQVVDCVSPLANIEE